MDLQKSFKDSTEFLQIPHLVSPVVNGHHVFNNFLSFYFKLKMKLFQR